MPSFSQLIQIPARYRPWKPLHLRYLFDDLRGTGRQPLLSDEPHLNATLEWLCRAQDVRKGLADEGGVSAGWSFEDGWLPSYPETSGYIVETFLAAAKLLERPELQHRAERILDWELSIQNADGSFPGHFGEPGNRPVIFNTGQIIHGLVEGYHQLARNECLEAALQAGHWMAKQQDEDGCWRRSVHNGIPHTYNTRAAWGLLRLALAANDRTLERAAVNNLRWALTQQTENGWFRDNAFTNGVPPFTHTIAYAIRGLLESGLLLNDEAMIAAALKGAESQAQAQRADGWLAGTFDENWTPRSNYCCLTGLAQFSIIWLRAAQKCSRPSLEKSAHHGIDFVKSNQRLTGQKDPQDGGIAGSVPIWGGYSRFEFPNWAAKFFADALMIKMAKIAIPAT